MISTMDSVTGRVGVIVPHGVLFRGASEGMIRKGVDPSRTCFRCGDRFAAQPVLRRAFRRDLLFSAAN